MAYLIGVAAGLLAAGFFGIWIAEQKGRSAAEGFFVGAFLPVLGHIILGLLPNKPPPYEGGAKVIGGEYREEWDKAPKPPTRKAAKLDHDVAKWLRGRS